MHPPPWGRLIAIETELKLAARTGDLPAVRRALEAMAGNVGGRPRATRSRLVSTYFDTPDHTLARHGSTLRVRRHGRKFVQTIKTTGAPGDRELSRGEWEDRVAGEQPDPQAAQTGPFLSPEIFAELRPLFRTEVSRLTIPLAPSPAIRIEAAIDRGLIRDGAQMPAEPISEIELELKSGAPTALYDVALKLLHVAPLRLERRSKSERGYLLAAHKHASVKAVHAAPVALSADLAGDEAFRRIAHACLDHLLHNEDAALSGDVEGIHQMRVAVRRLRAMLSAFSPLLPHAQRRRVSDELRWLAGLFGDARNLDVFADSLLASARDALPAAPEFDRLARALERRRRAAHAGVRSGISSLRYTETLLEVLRWLDGDDWHLAGAAALHDPIALLAPRMLDRFRNQVAKRARKFHHQSPNKRHRLRIALKKLRYAAEMFGSVYEPAAVKQFIQRLKRLQDDLGDANDVRVAHEIVARLVAERERGIGIARAGHLMLDWHRQRIAKHEPQLRNHMAELLATESFWPAPDLD